MSRPIAFITGASSGIGAAMATVLAEAGHDLVLVARRADRLAALAERLSDAGASSETLTVDLSEKAGLKRAVERAAAGDIDVLVSNAGVSAYGPFAEIDPGELDRAWTLNADVTPVLARAALPGMLGRGRGGIISVASNLAFSAGADQPPGTNSSSGTPGTSATLPQRALYVGAKAGTMAFTRVLASELHGTGVQATVVCPGLVSTEWNGGKSQGPRAMTAEDVAQAGWVGFSLGEVVCLPGLEDEQLVEQFTGIERRIMGENLGSELATRYRNQEASASE